MNTNTPRIILYTLLTSIVLVACNNDSENQFLITHNQVGLITPKTNVDELETIFTKDSVAESAYEGELRYASTERFHIFDNTGKALLDITPSKDSIKTVGNINILSNTYHTKAGLSINSTFGDIKKHYTINGIDNLWNNVVIHVNDLNAHFTIDKKYLDAKHLKNTLYDVSEKDIPETAPIKYFMVVWN